MKCGLFIGLSFSDPENPIFKLLANTGGYYRSSVKDYHLKSIVNDSYCVVGFLVSKEYKYIDVDSLKLLMDNIRDAMKEVLISVSKRDSQLSFYNITREEILDLITYIGAYVCYGEFRK